MASRSAVRADQRAMPGRRKTADGVSIVLLSIGLCTFLLATGPGKWLFVAITTIALVLTIIDFGKPPPLGPGKRGIMLRDMQRRGYTQEQIDFTFNAHKYPPAERNELRATLFPRSSHD